MDGTLDRARNVAALVAGLRNHGSEHVFEVEAQIRELAEHPGWDALAKLIEDGRMAIYELIERNAATMTPAQIALHTGWLSGLRSVTDLPDAVKAKADAERAAIRELDEALEAA